MLQQNDHVLIHNILLQRLADPDVFVRIEVAEELYRTGENRQSLRALNEIIVRGDAHAQLVALETLQRLGYNVSSARELVDRNHA